MKIAFIIEPQVIVSNKSNGIRSQAETWAKMLSVAGHQVDLVSNWGNYDWTTYDAIHFFGIGFWSRKIVQRLSKLNAKLICSPIIDFNPNFNERENLFRKALAKHSHGFFKTNAYEDCKNYKGFSKICVRSQFEGDFIHRNYDVSTEKIVLVPLAYSSTCVADVSVEKENFCLHISSIYQGRKNVVRLIEAAKKYNFNLVLAGNKGSEQQFAPLKKAIGDAKNIQVLGFITEEQKIDLYKRAKVFALPSLSEGVGIVALDAAYYGCEIVITNIEGPKEYYDGRCVEVNPFNIDDIGQAVINIIEGKKRFQPETSNYIKEKYSEQSVCDSLVNAYLAL